jgi:hypothetical protein
LQPGFDLRESGFIQSTLDAASQSSTRADDKNADMVFARDSEGLLEGGLIEVKGDHPLSHPGIGDAALHPFVEEPFPQASHGREGGELEVFDSALADLDFERSEPGIHIGLLTMQEGDDDEGFGGREGRGELARNAGEIVTGDSREYARRRGRRE